MQQKEEKELMTPLEDLLSTTNVMLARRSFLQEKLKLIILIQWLVIVVLALGMSL